VCGSAAHTQKANISPIFGKILNAIVGIWRKKLDEPP